MLLLMMAGGIVLGTMILSCGGCSGGVNIEAKGGGKTLLGGN